MFKKVNQSVLDTLIRMLPNLKNNDIPNLKLQKDPDYIEAELADSLFDIWKNAKQVKDRVYKKPVVTSLNDIEQMEKRGLVKKIGENIEITKKGEKVIKIMILGDNSSALDKDEIKIDYLTALKNAKYNSKLTKTANKKDKKWWEKFLKNEYRN